MDGADDWGVAEQLDPKNEEYRFYLARALEALNLSVRFLETSGWATKDGWRLEGENKETGAKVYSKTWQPYGKVFTLEADLNFPVEDFFKDAYYDLDLVTGWNPSISEYRKLFDIGTQSSVVYSATYDLLGGLVKSRDFVDARCWRKKGGAYYVSGQHIDCANMPPQKGRVRGENRPGVSIIAPSSKIPGGSHMTWLMNSDLKGMLLKSVVDRVMHSTMLEYITCMSKHFEALKQKR